MNKKLVAFGQKITLTLRKHSPEILVVSGVIGLVAAGVLACKETTHLDEVLAKGEKRSNELADKMNRLDDIVDHLPEEEKDDYRLSEQEEKKEIATMWIKNAFDVAKLYAPSVALAVFSTAAILGGFGILKKREAALSLAFAEMSAAYVELKRRIKDSVGEEKADEIINGLKKELKEVVKDDGTVVVEEVATASPINDPYTFRWDEETTRESGAYRKGCIEDNEAFLKGVQAALNNKLRNLTGYIFLNEVLEALGLPITKAGQEVGWVMNPYDGYEGDDYIDFGIEEVDELDANLRLTRRYILHFNCDGYILDTFEHAWEGEK